jgi:hypothetical protein
VETLKHLAKLFFFLGLALAAASCTRKVECTSEVTAGAGTYKATATGAGERAPISKLALHDACERMCVATKATAVDTCAARCAIDAGAGKIGARTLCTP